MARRAATTNELFTDAITRRQIYLQHFSQGMTRDIVRLLDETEADVRDVLARRLQNIVDQGGVDFGPTTTARLQVLENAIERIRSPAFDAATGKWIDDLSDMGQSEIDFLKETLNDISPVKLDLALPATELLAAVVTSQPFQGNVMGEWAQKLEDDDIARIMENVRIGLVQGDTTDEISRRIFGSSALNGADGVVEKTRHGVRAITQTAIGHVANEARSLFYTENDDIIGEEVYVAVLDSHTTELCASLDGTRYPVGEGPQPPLHWNCRSTRVGVIKGEDLVGKRPANASVAGDMEGMDKSEREDYLNQIVGQVSARTTYEEFLARQTESFQDEVLGQTRGALFRDGGLTLNKFVTRTGRVYTLDELRAAEPRAFRRAGV